MKNSLNKTGKTDNIKAKKTIRTKIKKKDDANIDDVHRLVHLLQVHQIELEHQNMELRIAQEELEVSRNKYVNLFDFSPIPYFTLNNDGVIKEVNLSAGKMFGMERSKIIGKRFAGYIPTAEKSIYNAFINHIFSTTEKQSCELSIVNKDKREYYVLLEGMILDNMLESEPNCQIAIIDLTGHRKAVEALSKSSEELKLLSSAKEKLFSIIAHDLRGPFQSLLGASELLATDIDKLSHEEIVLFSKGLNNNLNSLYRLLENLLQWSLMQRNMLVYKPVIFNLNDLACKILEISEQSAVNKEIAITNSLNPGIFVFADSDMIRSVIHNILMNAIKFTPQKGKIIISSKENADTIEVSIKDSGVGVESGDSYKLFNFDTFITTKGTNGEKGTGLGLPLCKEFVERNNGRIWVESELGKGSEFSFSLRKAPYEGQ